MKATKIDRTLRRNANRRVEGSLVSGVRDGEGVPVDDWAIGV